MRPPRTRCLRTTGARGIAPVSRVRRRHCCRPGTRTGTARLGRTRVLAASLRECCHNSFARASPQHHGIIGGGDRAGRQSRHKTHAGDQAESTHAPRYDEPPASPLPVFFQILCRHAGSIPIGSDCWPVAPGSGIPFAMVRESTPF
jgi:hypothetical protein